MSDTSYVKCLSSAVATTPRNGTLRQADLAKTLAERFGVPYMPRGDTGLEQMFQQSGVDVLIIADDPVILRHRTATTPLFFHPSMGAQRMERLRRGEPDRLLTVMGLGIGDVVVDATVGLASDALVFAHQVGPTGRVIGLEASPYLYGVLMAVREFGANAYPQATELLRQIEIHFASHVAWLKAQPADSVDAVYFDPMFRMPAEASSSMAPLRAFAIHTALSDEAVDEAKRVARRCVVIKERPGSGVFLRHGLVPDSPRRKIAYGVWRKQL
ncbi:hypothetical protein AAC03nite_06870 [Alicyclobacillus acidoterrestris]|nr:hypothetical protein AAC03nite_06870 [Alicyclobacillus acidoterrestris]